MLSDLVGPALGGVQWGLQFNPLAAVVGAAGAAALVGYPSAPRSRWLWAGVLLTGAWLIGDGLSIAISLPAGPLTAAGGWGLAVMVAVSLGVGFLLPAAAGAYVGRRVTHGTGWLSAIAVAATVAGALCIIAPALSDAISAGAGG